MGSTKYDVPVKGYTTQKLKQLKEAAKKQFIEVDGEISVKVLSRTAQVPQSYIRKWMKEENWLDLVKEQPGDLVRLSPTTKDAIYKGAVDFNISEQEELFCYHYLKCRNSTTAALRAGYTPSYAHNKAYLLLSSDRIKSFLLYIRGIRNQELMLDSVDLMQFYMRIAFSDMTDFVKFGPSGVVPKPSGSVDGQLITKVKEGDNGSISIELIDRKWALDKIEQYIDMFPDWRKPIEEQKLHLMKEKLEIEKQKMSLGDPEGEDDGFLEALAKSAKGVWSNEAQT